MRRPLVILLFVALGGALAIGLWGVTLSGPDSYSDSTADSYKISTPMSDSDIVEGSIYSADGSTVYYNNDGSAIYVVTP